MSEGSQIVGSAQVTIGVDASGFQAALQTAVDNAIAAVEKEAKVGVSLGSTTQGNGPSERPAGADDASVSSVTGIEDRQGGTGSTHNLSFNVSGIRAAIQAALEASFIVKFTAQQVRGDGTGAGAGAAAAAAPEAGAVRNNVSPEVAAMVERNAPLAAAISKLHSTITETYANLGKHFSDIPANDAGRSVERLGELVARLPGDPRTWLNVVPSQQPGASGEATYRFDGALRELLRREGIPDKERGDILASPGSEALFAASNPVNGGRQAAGLIYKTTNDSGESFASVLANAAPASESTRASEQQAPPSRANETPPPETNRRPSQGPVRFENDTQAPPPGYDPTSKEARKAAEQAPKDITRVNADSILSLMGATFANRDGGRPAESGSTDAPVPMPAEREAILGKRRKRIYQSNSAMNAEIARTGTTTEAQAAKLAENKQALAAIKLELQNRGDWHPASEDGGPEVTGIREGGRGHLVADRPIFGTGPTAGRDAARAIGLVRSVTQQRPDETNDQFAARRRQQIEDQEQYNRDVLGTRSSYRRDPMMQTSGRSLMGNVQGIDVDLRNLVRLLSINGTRYFREETTGAVLGMRPARTRIDQRTGRERESYPYEMDADQRYIDDLAKRKNAIPNIQGANGPVKAMNDTDVIRHFVNELVGGDPASADAVNEFISQPEVQQAITMQLRAARKVNTPGGAHIGNTTLGGTSLDARYKAGLEIESLKTDIAEAESQLGQISDQINERYQAGKPISELENRERALYGARDAMVQRLSDREEVADDVRPGTVEQHRRGYARGQVLASESRERVGSLDPAIANAEAYADEDRVPGAWVARMKGQQQRGGPHRNLAGELVPGHGLLDFLQVPSPAGFDDMSADERNEMGRAQAHTFLSDKLVLPLMDKLQSARMNGETGSRKQMIYRAWQEIVKDYSDELAALPDTPDNKRLAKSVRTTFQEMYQGVSQQVVALDDQAQEYIDRMYDVRTGGGRTIEQANKGRSAEAAGIGRMSTRGEKERAAIATAVFQSKAPKTSMEIEALQAEAESELQLNPRVKNKTGETMIAANTPITRLVDAEEALANTSADKSHENLLAQQKARAEVDSITAPAKAARRKLWDTREAAMAKVQGIMAGGATSTQDVRGALASEAGLETQNGSLSDEAISGVQDRVVREALEILQHRTPDNMYFRPRLGGRASHRPPGGETPIVPVADNQDQAAAEQQAHDRRYPLYVTPLTHDVSREGPTGTQTQDTYDRIGGFRIGTRETAPPEQNIEARYAFEASEEAALSRQRASGRAENLAADGLGVGGGGNLAAVAAIDAKIRAAQEHRAKIDAAEKKWTDLQAAEPTTRPAAAMMPIAAAAVASHGEGFVAAPEPMNEAYFQTQHTNDWILAQSQARYERLKREGPAYVAPTNEEREAERLKFTHDVLPGMVKTSMDEVAQNPTTGLLHGPYDLKAATGNTGSQGSDWFEMMNYGPSLAGPGSKFHVSATGGEAQRTLEIVDKIARDMQVPYKFVRSTKALEKGAFGPGGDQQGKFITAYPTPEKHQEFAEAVAQALEAEGIGGSAPLATGEIPYAPGLPITHRWVENASGSGFRHAQGGGYDAAAGREPTLLQRDAYQTLEGAGPARRPNPEIAATAAQIAYLRGGKSDNDRDNELKDLMKQREEAVAGNFPRNADGTGYVNPAFLVAGGAGAGRSGGPGGPTQPPGGKRYDGAMPGSEIYVIIKDQMKPLEVIGLGASTASDAAGAARGKAAMDRANFAYGTSVRAEGFVQREIDRFRAAGKSDEQITQLFRGTPFANLAANLGVGGAQGGTGSTAGSLAALRRQAGLSPMAKTDVTTPEQEINDRLKIQDAAHAERADRAIFRRGFQASLTDFIQAPFFEKQAGNIDRYRNEAAQLGKLRDQELQVSRRFDAARETTSTFMTQQAARTPGSRGYKKGEAQIVASQKLEADIAKEGQATTEQREAQEKIKLGAQADLPSGLMSLRNLGVGAMAGGIATAGATIVFQITSQILQGAEQVLSVELGKAADRMLDFANTASVVGNTLSDATRQMGGFSEAAIAGVASQSGVSVAQLDVYTPALEQRASIEAGNKAAVQQLEFVRAGRNIASGDRGLLQPYGGTPGLTRSTGGAFGTDINATPDTAVTMARMLPGPEEQSFIDQIPYVGKLFSDLDAVGNGIYGAIYGPEHEKNRLLSTSPGGSLVQLPAGMPGGTNADPEITKQFNATIKGWNQSLEKGSSSLRFFTEATEDQANATEKSLIESGMNPEYARRYRQLGIGIENIDTGQRMGEKDAGKALGDQLLNDYATGQGIPSSEMLLRNMQPALEAQIRAIQMQSDLAQRGRQASFGMGVLAAPPIAPSMQYLGVQSPIGPPAPETGIPSAMNAAIPESVLQSWDQFKGTANSTFEEIQKRAAAGIEQLKNFGLNDQQIAQIKSYGEQIKVVQERLMSGQATAFWQDYNRGLELGKRQLGDMLGLLGKQSTEVKGVGDVQATNLGTQERIVLLKSRELTLLGQELQQRQISFQTSLAGFMSEGLTPEEIAARQDQAKYVADIAQRQLNLNKDITGASFKIVDEQNLRAFQQSLIDLEKMPRDLVIKMDSTELGILQQQMGLLRDDAVAQAGIIVEQYKTVESMMIQTAATLATQSKEAFDTIFKNVQDTITKIAPEYKKMLDAISAGGTYTPSTSPTPESLGRDASWADTGGPGGTPTGSYSGAGFSPTVHIHVGSVGSQTDLDDVVRAVERALNQKSSLYGLRAPVAS